MVVGSDLTRTGWFESSNDLLNRFHENVVWGMRGNFLDVPTDCPQRDERLGWTGDIQVFSPTASSCSTPPASSPTGSPTWPPNSRRTARSRSSSRTCCARPGPAAAAWGDAATIVPWVIYQRTGDVGLLRRQLPSMRAWVDKMAELAGPDHLWTGGFQFGDWLDPTAPPDRPVRGQGRPGRDRHRALRPLGRGGRRGRRR